MIRHWDKSKLPTGPFVLNEDSIQAQGLGYWWPLGSSGNELLRGRSATLSSGWALDLYGAPAATFDGSAQGGQAGTVDLSSTNAINVAFRMLFTSTGVGDLLAMEHTANINTANQGFYVDVTCSASAGLSEIATKGNVGRSQYTFNRPSAGVWHDWFAVFDRSPAGNDTVQAYIDGVSQSMSPVLANNNTNNFSSDTLNFACRNNASLRLACQMYDVRIYLDNALAATRAALMTDAGVRYELWYPLRSRKWFSVAAGGTVPYWAFVRNNHMVGVN